MDSLFDVETHEINMDIVNYDGFVTPNGFLIVRTSDSSSTYPTHSDYARYYMKKEWNMDFDNGYDALLFMTNDLGFVQYSNRVYIEDEQGDTWHIYKDAMKEGKYNDNTIRNLYLTCRNNQDFYEMAKGKKK